MLPRGVALVEGASDAVAIETLARRRGTLRDDVKIVVLHGYTNLRTALRALEPVAPPRRTVLCDAGAEAWTRRVIGDGIPCRVCHTDLEDEFLRALGVDGVTAVIEEQGELGSLSGLVRQAGAHLRTDEERIHRFLGARSGRKYRYAGLLAARLDLDALPEPLRGVLDDVGL